MKALNSAGIFNLPRSSNLAFGLPLNPISESSQDAVPPAASFEVSDSPPGSSSGVSVTFLLVSVPLEVWNQLNGLPNWPTWTRTDPVCAKRPRRASGNRARNKRDFRGLSRWERPLGPKHKILGFSFAYLQPVVKVNSLDSLYFDFLGSWLADSTKVVHTWAKGEYIAKTIRCNCHKATPDVFIGS